MSRKIVIIDDSQEYREKLQTFLSDDGDVLAFAYPYDFCDHFKAPEDIQDVDMIVIDFKFDNCNAQKQSLLGHIKHHLNFKGITVLWSLESDIPDSYQKNFDVVFPKRLFTFAEVQECIHS